MGKVERSQLTHLRKQALRANGGGARATTPPFLGLEKDATCKITVPQNRNRLGVDAATTRNSLTAHTHTIIPRQPFDVVHQNHKRTIQQNAPVPLLPRTPTRVLCPSKHDTGSAKSDERGALRSTTHNSPVLERRELRANWLWCVSPAAGFYYDEKVRSCSRLFARSLGWNVLLYSH